MAEGYLRAKKGIECEVFSAGTNPSTVNPFAIQVMQEIGVNISGHTSKHLEQFLEREFDKVITVCDFVKESCPYFPQGKELIHKSFPDPSSVVGNSEEIISEFRKVRDLITEWIDVAFRIR